MKRPELYEIYEWESYADQLERRISELEGAINKFVVDFWSKAAFDLRAEIDTLQKVSWNGVTQDG